MHHKNSGHKEVALPVLCIKKSVTGSQHGKTIIIEMKHLLCLIALLLCYAHCSAQESLQSKVILKNGNTIYGAVTKNPRDNSIEITTDDGETFFFDDSEVRKIKKQFDPVKNGFQQNITMSIGFNRFNTTFSSFSEELNYIAGYRKERIFIGVGCSVRFLNTNTFIWRRSQKERVYGLDTDDFYPGNLEIDENGIKYYSRTYIVESNEEVPNVYFPLFAHIKIFIGHERLRTQPFVSFSGGYCFAKNQLEGTRKNEFNSALLEFGIGVNTRLTQKFGLIFAFNYRYNQYINNQFYNNSHNVTFLQMGISF